MVTRERELARLIDNTFFAHYDGGAPGQACSVLGTLHGPGADGCLAIRADHPAPAAPPGRGSGQIRTMACRPTHHSYVWEPDSAVDRKLASLPVTMPELHVLGSYSRSAARSST